VNRADLLDWSLHSILSALPSRTCSDIGAALSPIMGKKSHPAQHRQALKLFERLRPDWAREPGGCEAAVDRLWANVGRTFAEFSVSHRMLRTGRVTAEGVERLDAALATGRPIVAIFPHLGNWELSEMQIGFRAPHRGAVIVAPPASDARSRIAEKIRRKVPADLLPMSPNVWRQAIAKLKTPGGGIMLAIDEAAENRVWGPSFGRPLRIDGNLGKAARLALMTRAIVLPFYNERLPGARFVTHFLPTLEFSGKSSDDGAVTEAVARMDELMQEPVLRLLDQWYMALNFTD
jgi:lauroyl/myristoyl acyltransferase